jgi:hypothetical protein
MSKQDDGNEWETYQESMKPLEEYQRIKLINQALNKALNTAPSNIPSRKSAGSKLTSTPTPCIAFRSCPLF